MCAMAVLRSPYAHARIVVDRHVARDAEPGVVYVLTGEEIERDDGSRFRPRPTRSSTAARDSPCVRCRRTACATSARRSRRSSPRTATPPMRALDLIEVDYEELPVVSDPRARRSSPAAPAGRARLGRQRDDPPATSSHGDADAAFAEADARRRAGVVNAQRVSPARRSSRAATLATYDPYADLLTFWASTQNPHPLRIFLAETLGMPETIDPRHPAARRRRLRPQGPDLPGGVAGRLPGPEARRARSSGSRSAPRTSSPAGTPARSASHYEAAYKPDGTRHGARRPKVDRRRRRARPRCCGWGHVVRHRVLPARPSTRSRTTASQLFIGRHQQVPVERLSRLRQGRGVVPDGPRHGPRGATRPASTAPRCGSRNFIPPDEFPFSQVSGAMLDSGDYPKALRRVLRDDRLRRASRRAGGGARGRAGASASASARS